MKKIIATLFLFASSTIVMAADVQTVKTTEIKNSDKKAVTIEIYAPDATTKLAREEIMKNVAQELESNGYEFINVVLRPTDSIEHSNSFGAFGVVQYSVDGCDLNGNQCSENKWNVKVTDYQLTEKDLKNINDVLNDVQY